MPQDSTPPDIAASLAQAARQARQCAHAPYSGFSVGAALLADDGQVYAGCNVENASYPEGNCAETSAIAAMVMGGGRRIVNMVVTGPGDVPVTPCGGCRQRIREFAGPDLPVICYSDSSQHLTLRLAELLPHSFGPERLETGK